MAEKYDFSKMFLNAEIKPIPNLQAELKPCPLCGEEASLDREYVFCDYCPLCGKKIDWKAIKGGANG